MENIANAEMQAIQNIQIRFCKCSEGYKTVLRNARAAH
jgi:hypothetical protein